MISMTWTSSLSSMTMTTTMMMMSRLMDDTGITSDRC